MFGNANVLVVILKILKDGRLQINMLKVVAVKKETINMEWMELEYIIFGGQWSNVAQIKSLKITIYMEEEE